MENYEYIKSIGQGMYGQVFLARHKQENKNYAIKRINFQDIDDKERKNIETEVLLLKQLQHPNIVSYKDSFLDKENYYNIVMVYCDSGDIYTKIKNAKKHFAESEILDWLVQICLALSYVHDKKILHRDLKTQNIFTQNQNTIRIGDFGIAKIFSQTREMAGSMIGTPLYMSPEQYNGKKYGFKSDIWSLGCCVFEMCNLKHAFEGNSWNAVVVKVLKGQHPPLNKMYSNELRNIAESMLNYNPNNRPTIASILERPIMKPKVANYILDYIEKYNQHLSDGDEIQVNILKEQAEKFGIFNTKLNKEIDDSNPNGPNSNSTGGNNNIPGVSGNNKINLVLNNLNSKDKDYLNSIKDNEIKALCENRENLKKKYADLEKEKKLLSEQIKMKNINRKNAYNYYMYQGSGSKEKDKDKQEKNKFSSLDKKNSHNTKMMTVNKNNNNLNDEYRGLDGKGLSSQSPKIQNRKNSSDMEEIQNNKLGHVPEKYTNKNLNSMAVSKNINNSNKPKRPLTSKKNNANQGSNKNVNTKEDESNNENPIPNNQLNSNNSNVNVNNINNVSLNVVEERINSVADRNKLAKITQELAKIKKAIDENDKKLIEKSNGMDINSLFKDNIVPLNINNLNNDNNGAIIEENENVDTNYNLNENEDQYDNDDAFEGNINLNEGDGDNNGKINNDNQSGDNLIDERISFFKKRCINSLGQKLFDKSYEYLKGVSNNNSSGGNYIEPKSVREYLINLFGKNNIGFWQLIDQILILENIKNNMHLNK